MLLAAALGLHLLPFAVRPALIGGDEPHYALMAHALATGGDLDLAEAYRQVAEGSKIAGRKFAGKILDKHLRPYGGGEIFSHPLGLPMLAAPLIWLKNCVSPAAPPDLLLGLMTVAITFLALAAGLDLVAALGWGRAGVLAVLTLYFSTPLWYYSRTFFTEPFLWALPVLALWAVSRRRQLLATVCLGLVVLVKEPAVLTVTAIVGVSLIVGGWRWAAALGAGPAVAGILYFAKNLLVYGNPLVMSQAFQVGEPLRGFIGTLFDSAHGLLPFAPVVAVILVSYPLGVLHPCTKAPLHTAALAVFLAWLVLVALWVDWRGGSCFGPRLLLPVLPAFVVPLAEAWSVADDHRWLAASLSAACILGFAVQWCAVLDPFRAFWSISLVELLTHKPLVTASGLLLGLALYHWVMRRVHLD
ncbi:MAG: hypothetical protein ACUVRY_10245 [Thermoanaerobaculaceae bacterium]